MSFFRFAARSAATFPRAVAAPSRATLLPRRAQFSAAAGLTKESITARVHEVLQGFEKVNPAVPLEPTTKFGEDLGLDSLDTVEVVMAIEEEFSIEIPDAEADEIVTVGQAIDYIAKTPEAL